jgi:hypothetical protein
MKTLRRILIAVVVFAAIFLAIAYIDGTTLPLDHTTTVSGVVNAPPDQVFARIADVGSGASWRHSVKSVQMLPAKQTAAGPQQSWIEDLGHGQTMKFLAVASDAPSKREVSLAVPNAAYGGSWIFQLAPGPKPNTTTLNITEDGYIKPPLYRFLMAHVLGSTRNLDQYLDDMQASFK